VESVLRGHGAVREVAVIGVPDDKWGEAIKAIVVLYEGYEPDEALATEIIDSARGKIAGYKLPKSMNFIAENEMPKTPTGKILHRALRETHSRKALS
jgi:acyl-coenzyme A synthetase/AMP-(fatty) acid ligase